MKKIRKFFIRVSDYLITKINVIQGMIRAIDNLTKAVRDLTRAYTALAKMQVEDRETLFELYSLMSPEEDVKFDLVEPLRVEKLTPLEQIELEKKKKQLN